MVEASLFDMVILLAIIASAFVSVAAVLIFVRRYLKKLAARTATSIDDYLVKIVEGPMVAFVFVLSAVSALGYWESRFPGSLPGWLSVQLGNLALGAGMMIATSVVAFILNQMLSNQIKKVIEGNPARETTFRLMGRVMMIAVYLGGSFAALTIIFPGLTGSLTTLLFGAGFLGIVLGLAAQKVIGNMLSGISVNLTQPIRIGDAVVIKGEFGFIQDITLRHTMIRTWDNRRMIIPNSVLDDEVIINYTLQDMKKLFPIVVYVPYDADVNRAEAVMVEECQKNPNVLPELKPIFQVLDFEEGAIKLRLLFLAKDQPTAFGTACEIRKAVKNRFDREGIKLSCPTRYVVSPEPDDAAKLTAESVGRKK